MGAQLNPPLRQLIQERVMDRHPQNPQNRGFEGFEGSAGAKKDIYLKKGRKGGVLRDSPSPHRSQLGRRARVTAATGAEAEVLRLLLRQFSFILIYLSIVQ